VQTFMARFVRPNGDRGVMYVLAVSAGTALVDVLKGHGPVAQVSVEPKRCAALLTPWPRLPRRQPAKADE
jgi:hypothetical protein